MERDKREELYCELSDLCAKYGVVILECTVRDIADGNIFSLNPVTMLIARQKDSVQ